MNKADAHAVEYLLSELRDAGYEAYWVTELLTISVSLSTVESISALYNKCVEHCRRDFTIEIRDADIAVIAVEPAD
jgi:predicted transposase YbfD/YdcC